MREYVCVVGSLNYDIIMKQGRMPRLGETYTADGVTYAGGGKGANQAVQCAKLGLDTVMVGRVGDDPFGGMLLRKLEGYGVDCFHVEVVHSPTGVGVVHALEDGSVYATIVPGANFDMDVAEAGRLEEVICGSRILILQLEIPTEVVEHVIRRAHGRGVYTILNAAPAKEMDREALRMADCLIVNETEASFYVGAGITDAGKVREHEAALRGLTDGTVIVTLGSKGSVLLGGDGLVEIAPAKADHVVETTGAGDSYIGAFAYGKFHGMADANACRFAARVSAVTVTRAGAQEAMPYIGDLPFP